MRKFRKGDVIQHDSDNPLSCFLVAGLDEHRGWRLLSPERSDERKRRDARGYLPREHEHLYSVVGHIARTHGGRRHGLSPSGVSPQVKITLSPGDVETLRSLAEAWRCSHSEVVRRLLRAATIEELHPLHVSST